MVDTVVRIENKNKTKLFRIMVEWQPEFFRLYLFESSNAWTTIVDCDSILLQASRMNMVFKDYFDLLRRFLTKEQSNVFADVFKKQLIIFHNGYPFFLVELEDKDYSETTTLLYDFLINDCRNMKERSIQLENQASYFQLGLISWQEKYYELLKQKHFSDFKNIIAFALLWKEKDCKCRILMDLHDNIKFNLMHLNETVSDDFVFNDCVFNDITSDDVASDDISSEYDASDYDASDYYASDYDASDTASGVEVVFHFDAESDTNSDELECIYLADEPVAGCSNSGNDFDVLGKNSPPPTAPARIKNNSSENIIIVSDDDYNEEQLQHASIEEEESDDVILVEDSETINTQKLLDQI